MSETAMTPLTKNARQRRITELLEQHEVRSQTERAELPLLVDTAADAVETLVLEGLEATQQRFNR